MSPPRRQRALTGPLDPAQASLWHKLRVLTSVESEQRTYEQAQSSLMSKLPLDIRMIIYDMVLGGMVFHLDSQTQKSRVLLDICRDPTAFHDPTHQCVELYTRRPSSAPREEYAVATGLLPLLVTCRRIYSEAIGTLYSANVFMFGRNAAAFRFLKTMIPSQRLHSIRHFRMRFMRLPHHPMFNSRSARDWTDLFDFFATEMTGLRGLYLALQMNEPMICMIKETADEEGTGWIVPMVSMAVEAERKRGCRVEIVTEGVTHDLGRIHKEISNANVGASESEVQELACVAVHKRIRMSLTSGHG